MIITRISPISGKQQTMDLTVTREEIQAWEDGELIQNAMPGLTSSEREFVKSGITDDEWKTMECDVREEEMDDEILALNAAGTGLLNSQEMDEIDDEIASRLEEAGIAKVDKLASWPASIQGDVVPILAADGSGPSEALEAVADEQERENARLVDDMVNKLAAKLTVTYACDSCGAPSRAPTARCYQCP